MLTYESIRDFVVKEKEATGFTELPKDFFSQAAVYIKVKSSAGKESWELDSAKRLLQDLGEMRERKLLVAAFYFVRSGVVPANITPDEKVFLENVVQNIRNFQKSNSPEPPKIQDLEFTEDVPRFVAPDMKEYGPFKKGESPQLPEDVKKLFLEKGLAK